MEALQTRILLKNVQGVTIAYLYDRESFDLLNIEKSDFDNTQYISVGDAITYNDERYTVDSISFTMYPCLYEINPKIGYNCQINVFLRNVD